MRGPVTFKGGLDSVHVFVCVEADEPVYLALDLVPGERPRAENVWCATCKVSVLEAHGAVAGLHGVDEARGLRVAEVLQGGYVEGGEHFVVFVDEIVAAVIE